MEKKVIIISGIAMFLGLLAAVLGFTAEAKKIKISEVTVSKNGTCKYPRSPALALGSIAGLALVIAQAIINTAAGCVCCKRRPLPSKSHWTISLTCFVISWITFIIGFLLLLMGAALNNERGEQPMYFGEYCYVVKPGVFAGGAVLSFASIALGVTYYAIVSSSKTMEPWPTQHNQGIAIAQPQIPTQNSQPVFVHEDTYNRQQFP